MNLSSVMFVLNEVEDYSRVSSTMQIPEEHKSELIKCGKEKIVGKLSEFWLETEKPWKALKKVLIRSDELPSAELACLMEMYVSQGSECSKLFYSIDVVCSFTDAPLKSEFVYDVLSHISNWKQFWNLLKIAEKPTKMATVSFFVEEPYFNASWKIILGALYQMLEDEAINVLFQYMKSLAGLSFSK